MGKLWRSISLYIIVFCIIILLIMMLNQNSSTVSSSNYSFGDLITKIENGEVVQLEIQSQSETNEMGRVRAILKDKSEITTEISSVSQFSEYVTQKLLDNPSMKVIVVPISKSNAYFTYILMIVVMVVAVFLLLLIMQQVQGGGGGGSRVMSFGKSKAKVNIDDKKKVTFQDVAGLDEEKEELSEIVEFLKMPKKFVELGARIPKGVLLVGPPGTGKTLLAKAVAGEAGVPFFSISGSDFVEMFVGVGASRVRDLFDQAKKNAPCIIFIDEIDAVGRRRGAGLGGGHDEREQTLNQLLVEMDGFGVNEGVIVVAATNRPDILDPALLRPGRFDRQVTVGVPDVKGREDILKVHAKGKPLADDVDLKVVAQTTSGFTGADLENLLNEAALLSARSNKKLIDMAEMRRAFIKVGVGTEKKSRVISKKERRVTAYHEAGHAIIFEVLSELDPVHSISVIPTGRAGGYTMPLPAEDKMYLTKKFMEQEIVALLGGRAAEFLILKDITTGASNDIERATALARSMVTKYGMSDILGPIQFGDERDEVFIGRDLAHSRNYGETVATEIDKEIKRIVESAYNEAISILEKHIDILEDSAKVLIEREKITGEEFRTLFSEEHLIKYKKDRSEAKETIFNSPDIEIDEINTISVQPEKGIAEEEINDKMQDENKNEENYDSEDIED